MTDPFAATVDALQRAGVHFLVTGVWGANYYSRGGLFVTQDQDLFLPESAENLVRAWNTCESLGLELDSHGEPLDSPRDLILAHGVVLRRALTSATDGDLLRIDLSLVMTGLTFDEVWQRRHTFVTSGIHVPVASLADIVAAKRAADRPKDRLFLTTHAAELQLLLRKRARDDG